MPEPEKIPEPKHETGPEREHEPELETINAQCNICLEELEHEYQLIRLGCCTGKYCANCIDHLKQHRQTKCPVCKQPNTLLGTNNDVQKVSEPILHETGASRLLNEVNAIRHIVNDRRQLEAERQAPPRLTIRHVEPISRQCKSYTQAGTRCRIKTTYDNGICHIHRRNPILSTVITDPSC